MIASILIITLLGWCAYRLLSAPLKTLLFVGKAAVILVLGMLVWLCLFALMLP